MERKIYFYDTDAGGIVYYGNYLQYLEEARTEFLEKRNLSVQEFKKRGLLYAVSHCSIFYRNPAYYGDILLCDARLKKISSVRLIFDQTVYEKKSSKLIVEAEVTLVCLDRNFKPFPIPEDLKEKLETSNEISS